MPAWAIVVGINRYPDPTGQTALRGAVADACDFAEWALDPLGGKVAPDRLFFWTHPWPANAAPLLTDFLAGGHNQWELFAAEPGSPPLSPRRGPYAIEIVTTAEMAGRKAYEAALEAEEEEDNESRRIFVFLAGHGVRAQEKNNPTDQTCYLAYDFRTTKSSTVQGLVACESFRNSLLTDRFDEVLLFLDCCRTTTSRLQDKAIPICDTAKVQPGSIWGQGNAAQDGKIAFETTKRPIRGAFSKTLMQGLRGLRDDSDRLSMDDLKNYVIKGIVAHTTQEQIPAVDYDPKVPPGPYVVAGPATAPLPAPPISAGQIAHVEQLPIGTQLQLLGSNGPIPGVPRLAVNGPTVQIPPLPNGLYELQVVGNHTQYAVFRQPGTARINVPQENS